MEQNRVVNGGGGGGDCARVKQAGEDGGVCWKRRMKVREIAIKKTEGASQQQKICCFCAQKIKHC